MALASTLTKQLATLGVLLPDWPEEGESKDRSGDWISTGLAYAEGIRLWRAHLRNASESTIKVVDQLMCFLSETSQLASWDRWLILALHPDVQRSTALDRWLPCIEALTSDPFSPAQLLGAALALAEMQQLAGATKGIIRLLSDCRCAPAECIEVCSQLIATAQTTWRMNEGSYSGESWQKVLALHAEWTCLLRYVCAQAQNIDLPTDTFGDGVIAILNRILAALGEDDQWCPIPWAQVQDLLVGQKTEMALRLIAESMPGFWGSVNRDSQARLVASQILARSGHWQQAEAMHSEAVKAITIQTASDVRLEAELTILRSESELLSRELSLALNAGALTTSDPESRTASGRGAAFGTRARCERFSRSQLGQDLWVLEKLDWKRHGYFVEFGATDGVLLSNTWLLEKFFDWDGICAEPNPRFYEQLQRNRTCRLSPACVYSKTGETMEFVLADAYGGLKAFSMGDQHAAKREAYEFIGGTIDVTTISLVDLLEEQGAPGVIDYLSIDTEGSEFAILEAFDWGRFQVRCITVEHNHSEQRGKIQTLLEGLGYTREAAKFDDWYFKADQA